MTDRDPNKLATAIAAVCPIHGVSIGSWDDRGSWSYQPTGAASPEQIQAADDVLSTWRLKDFSPSPAEKRARRYSAEADVIAASIVRYQALIEVETNPGKKAKLTTKMSAAKTALVQKSNQIEATDPDE